MRALLRHRRSIWRSLTMCRILEHFDIEIAIFPFPLSLVWFEKGKGKLGVGVEVGDWKRRLCSSFIMGFLTLCPSSSS